MREKQYIIFTVMSLVFFVLSGVAVAEKNSYYLYIKDDVNGYKFAHFNIDNKSNYRKYNKVYFDNIGRIQKYEIFKNGNLFSTVNLTYIGKTKEIEKSSFVSKSGQGYSLFRWVNGLLVLVEKYDKDGKQISKTEYLRKGRIVESKYSKGAKLINHSRYYYSDDQNIDYKEFNLNLYKKYKLIYRKNPNIGIEKTSRFGQKDYEFKTTGYFDKYFNLTKSVSESLATGKKTSESYYTNGLRVKEINYQKPESRIFKKYYDENDLFSTGETFLGDKLIYKIKVLRHSTGDVEKTIGTLPDGTVFAECLGEIVKYFKKDSKPLHGKRCEVYVKLKQGW